MFVAGRDVCEPLGQGLMQGDSEQAGGRQWAEMQS